MAERNVKFGSDYGSGYVSNNVRLKNPPQFTVELFILGVSQGMMLLGNDVFNKITFNSYSDIKFRITPLNGKFLKSVGFRNTNNAGISKTNFNPIQYTYYDYPLNTISSTVTAGYFACIEVDVVNADGSPISDAPEKPKKRNYLVGDYRAGSGAVSQNGQVNYNASIEVTRPFDPENPQNSVQVTDLIAGVSTEVNIEGYTEVKAIFTPKENNILKEVNWGNRGNNKLPVTNSLAELIYTDSQIVSPSTDLTTFQVITETSVTKKFIFGNAKDSQGLPILQGVNPFTGTLTLYGGFNPDDPSNPEQEVYNIVSGSDLNVVLGSKWAYGEIVLNIVDGFKFIGVDFPSETTFTNNSITYDLSSEELNPDSNINRYYVAMVESTGNPDPEPSDKPDTILNNYFLTKDELYEFQKQIYNVVAFEETENTRTPITDYISNLYIYPFKIPRSALYGRQVIKCRNREFNIAEQFNSDVINLSLGNITIDKVHNNALDYVGVNCSLYLPFISGSIDLDAQKVVGKELNINYMININDGSTTVNITDILTDVIINVSKTQLGSIQPFFDFERVTQKDYTPSQSINDIDTAYIIMEMPNYDQTKPTAIIEGDLINIKGRISVNDVNLKTDAFTNEKIQILSLLSQGVIIK